MKLPAAIIFDLDGVITDTAEYHYLAWKTLSEDLGISFTREFNESLKGISRLDSLEKILIHGNKQDDFTEDEKRLLAEKKNTHYVSLIEGITPLDVLPGINDLILQIKQEKIKIGLASVSKNAFTVLDRLGLTEQFDTIVDAKTIKNGKPDPEIFLQAANQLAVNPQACIGIEDASAGVEAIKAAKMFAVGIGNKQTLAYADLVYSQTCKLNFKEIIAAYSNY